MPNKIEFSDFAELDSRAQRLRSRRAEPGPAAGAETALHCTALHCTALLEDRGLGDPCIQVVTATYFQRARPGAVLSGGGGDSQCCP